MKADRGLTVERMVELGAVSRSSFYRFEADADPGPDPDLDLRRHPADSAGVAQLWPATHHGRVAAARLDGEYRMFHAITLAHIFRYQAILPRVIPNSHAAPAHTADHKPLQQRRAFARRTLATVGADGLCILAEATEVSSYCSHEMQAG